MESEITASGAEVFMSFISGFALFSLGVVIVMLIMGLALGILYVVVVLGSRWFLAKFGFYFDDCGEIQHTNDKEFLKEVLKKKDGKYH